jgi:hypothetical protein
LYKLRKIIGGAAPITQPALAELINAALPTLKCLGNRPMSAPLLKKIRFATGAIWDPAKKRWLFDNWLLSHAQDTGERFVPFTRELFEAYRQILTSPPADPARKLVLMMAWLDQLFKRTPPDRQMQLKQRVSFFVEKACRDLSKPGSSNSRSCSVTTNCNTDCT